MPGKLAYFIQTALPKRRLLVVTASPGDFGVPGVIERDERNERIGEILLRCATGVAYNAVALKQEGLGAIEFTLSGAGAAHSDQEIAEVMLQCAVEDLPRCRLRWGQQPGGIGWSAHGKEQPCQQISGHLPVEILGRQQT